jgi:hypothetical protein
MKTQILELKNEIKKLVEVQKELKNQRKTVKLVGTRTMEPWQAAMKHHSNRHQLRLMYAAYAKMRGQMYCKAENNCILIDQYHPLFEYEKQINAIIEKYGKE